MSDGPVDNTQLALISGQSASGKSASLRNIRDQAQWMYLNCESNKRLPFKNKFDSYTITDPYQVMEGFDALLSGVLNRDGIIVDTLTFLMDMYESQYVLNAANTMQAWGAYQQFLKELMQTKVAKLKIPVLFLAHTKTELNEQAMVYETAVPIKGALKNNGVEAFFSTVVTTKKVELKKLEKFENELLRITDEDRDVGFKHVFQTRITKETTGERIRSPMGMFTREQTYIDNDAQLLLDHLHNFYK
jgi:hypothetical protein